MLLDYYVENLMRKTLGKQDIRLLEVLGFGKCLDILTRQKEKELTDKEILETKKTGNNSRLTMRLALNDSDDHISTNKRNPLADVYRE